MAEQNVVFILWLTNHMGSTKKKKKVDVGIRKHRKESQTGHNIPEPKFLCL